MTKKLVRHQSINRELAYDLNRIQDNVADVIDEILEKPQTDSFLLEDISLTTGSTNLVIHKLGRKRRGWIIVNRNAGATIYEDGSSTANLGIYIPLITDVNVTISLVVF